MEFKGTKGNWSYRVGGKNKHGVQEIEIDSDYGIDSLATVYDAEIKDSEDEAIANAKLIAAAPELLKALQDIIKLRDLIEYKTPVLEQHTGEADAINKAIIKCYHAVNKALS